MKSNFQDVYDFNVKFDLPRPREPLLLTRDVYLYRRKFLEEELREFETAHLQADWYGCADALIDLVYVALGTAVMMGVPWQALWNEVHRANMEKIRVSSERDSKRGHYLDVVKPPNWRAPDLSSVFTGHYHSGDIYRCLRCSTLHNVYELNSQWLCPTCA